MKPFDYEESQHAANPPVGRIIGIDWGTGKAVSAEVTLVKTMDGFTVGAIESFELHPQCDGPGRAGWRG